MRLRIVKREIGVRGFAEYIIQRKRWFNPFRWTYWCVFSSKAAAMDEIDRLRRIESLKRQVDNVVWDSSKDSS